MKPHKKERWLRGQANQPKPRTSARVCDEYCELLFENIALKRFGHEEEANHKRH